MAVGRRPQFISLGFASVPVIVTLLLLHRTPQVPWVSPAWPRRGLYPGVSTGGGDCRGGLADPGGCLPNATTCLLPPL